MRRLIVTEFISTDGVFRVLLGAGTRMFSTTDKDLTKLHEGGR